MKRLSITLLLLLTFAPAWAATYCMRADGTAANLAAATGPTTDAAACMSVATHNAASMTSGDTVILADDGGDFTATIIPPTANVTYQGEAGVVYGINSGTTGTYAGGGIYRGRYINR